MKCLQESVETVATAYNSLYHNDTEELLLTFIHVFHTLPAILHHLCTVSDNSVIQCLFLPYCVVYKNLSI